jgi:hypothetical protein
MIALGGPIVVISLAVLAFFAGATTTADRPLILGQYRTMLGALAAS